jgi:prepilin-type N-terminal cleavage/methylation domain-containing protein
MAAERTSIAGLSRRKVESNMTHQNRKSGFTIVELLVVVSIIALLIALLLPAVAKGRDKALITQSVSNLKNLATANESYAGDWGDRQFTAIPDDTGLANGDCTLYKQNIACPPQVIVGTDPAGSIWGAWLGGGGKCSGVVGAGSCGLWGFYPPINFQNPSQGFGSFRVPNLKPFAAYVGRRFYDPTFYAPKDVLPLATAARFFTSPGEFDTTSGEFEPSSYSFSPAAMYDAKVLARNGTAFNGQGYTAPQTLKAGYRSPPVSRCKYPSLKTRMIEQNWLQNTPDSPVNSAFAGGTTPWYFNHGFNSAPACLFFDGHIELVGCQRSMQAGQRIAASQGSVWSRNTPFGSEGFYGAQAYDFLVDTSFHILTTDGIEGRDVLGAEG